MALTQQFSSPADVTAGKLNTMSVPVVTATSDIAGGVGPFAGQVIFNTTDNMLYRYDGSTWQAFAATGGATSATTHEARYEQKSAAQSIANATDTKVKFETAVTTCSDVTASGTSNTDFLLNRAGLWLATACVRMVAGSANERQLFLATGTVVGTLANRFAGQSVTNVGAAPVALSAASLLRVNAATSVMCGMYQNNGGALNVDVAFGSTNHIALAWLRPL